VRPVATTATTTRAMRACVFWAAAVALVLVLCCREVTAAAAAATPAAGAESPRQEQLTPQHNATFFSPERAKIFALFSQAAYCSAPSLTAWNCTPCQQPEIAGFTVSRVVFGTKSQTQAFVGSDADDIVVSFRGTDNLENWIKDLDFPKTTSYPKCPTCKVHAGFWGAWLELQTDVLAEVEQLARRMPLAKIFVTGHSLGAALAALCAAELGASSHSLGFPIEGVYTYGQPRVGDVAFQKFYSTGEHVSWRVTHWRDIVPHLPFESFGFHHTSTEVFYNEENSVWKICDGTGEDDACADQFDLYSVEDHRHYLNVSITSCST
jgi:hypothetical protein